MKFSDAKRTLKQSLDWKRVSLFGEEKVHRREKMSIDADSRISLRFLRQYLASETHQRSPAINLNRDDDERSYASRHRKFDVFRCAFGIIISGRKEKRIARTCGQRFAICYLIASHFPFVLPPRETLCRREFSANGRQKCLFR